MSDSNRCNKCGYVIDTTESYIRCECKKIKEGKLLFGMEIEENNDFCLHCLRGDIKIIPDPKRYVIIIDKTNKFFLERVKITDSNYRWEISDEFGQILYDRMKLKTALIKKIKDENI